MLPGSIEPCHLTVMNLYCPRADPEKPERARFKLQFYRAVDIKATMLRRAGDLVVVLGDVNTCHRCLMDCVPWYLALALTVYREVDHCDPYEEFSDHPGRRFLNHFLHTEGAGAGAGAGEEDLIEDWQAVHVDLPEKQFVDR